MTSEGIVASHNDGVKPQPGCFLHTIRFLIAVETGNALPQLDSFVAELYAAVIVT